MWLQQQQYKHSFDFVGIYFTSSTKKQKTKIDLLTVYARLATISSCWISLSQMFFSNHLLSNLKKCLDVGICAQWLVKNRSNFKHVRREKLTNKDRKTKDRVIIIKCHLSNNCLWQNSTNVCKFCSEFKKYLH